jgi:chromosome segregation ATPase
MLSVSVFSIFKEYVGILLFICLPVILLSAGIAIWLHYRQKKNKAAIKTDAAADGEANSSLPKFTSAETVALSPLAVEDKVGLIKECRKQLSKSHAKYLALKQDFSTTQKTIIESENELPENFDHMENLNEKIAAYEKQIMDLQNKLEVLETVIPIQDETYFLRQALREKDNEITRLKEQVFPDTNNTQAEHKEEVISYSITDHDTNEYIRRIEKLQEEKAIADRKLSEQDYLKDAYSQNKLQVEFLQNQLEQRIKDHSQSEHKIKELTAFVQELSAQFAQSEGKILFLNQQIESKHHEIEHVQLTSDQKDTEIHRAKEELQTKNSQVAHLENLLADLKEQNSVLNISFGESQGAITSLKEQLTGEQQHIHQLEDKLLKNKQLLERIYRDLESSVDHSEHKDFQQALVKPMY